MIRPADSARRSAASAALAALAALAWPGAGQAQVAQPVVQSVPDPAQIRLTTALRTLARSPRSVDALLEAADASLAVEDVDAATGFVQRAEASAPADARVRAARAQILVRQQQPVEALRLFGEAERMGVLNVSHIADRGLAFDLIGDSVHAQQDYTTALATGPNPVVARRLALSQAISGNQQASEATLLPMLQRNDLAAFRTRAFALAILGKSDEAVSIAETMLPARLSSRLAPYLRYMPRLTRAQQAAAANLGAFPQAAQIGRDDPALAAYSPPATSPAPRTADARLVPSGEPLGNRPPVVRAAVQPPAQPALAQTTPAPSVPAPTPPAQTALAQATLAQTPAPLQAAELPPVAAQTVVTTPAVQIVQTAAPPPPVSATPAPEPAIEPPSPRDLLAAFSDFALPVRATVPAAPEAVDITKIEPRRETPRVQAPPPEPAPKPKPKPVIPSRQWVQVATGKDTAALAFDWRRIKRTGGDLLARSEAHTVPWGQTQRLVVGPFASAREADQMVAKLKEKKIDSFRFTSAQGEEVKALD